MRIDIISACPELLESPLKYSIIGRAIKNNIASVYIHNLHDYSLDKHRKVDDYVYGFQSGMVLKIEPIDNCITYLKGLRHYDEIIFTSPDAPKFNQHEANKLSLLNNIIILCGHYKGVDQRVREHLITKEYSIGDYVLTGGEIPATVITDAIIRLLPGAIGNANSLLDDSFQDGLLEKAVYTRPASYKGWEIPEILSSGHQKKVEEWILENNILYTEKKETDNNL